MVGYEFNRCLLILCGQFTDENIEFIDLQVVHNRIAIDDYPVILWLLTFAVRVQSNG